MKPYTIGPPATAAAINCGTAAKSFPRTGCLRVAMPKRASVIYDNRLYTDDCRDDGNAPAGDRPPARYGAGDALAGTGSFFTLSASPLYSSDLPNFSRKVPNSLSSGGPDVPAVK